MNRTLLFDFTVNKESNIINVKREFAANLELVWNNEKANNIVKDSFYNLFYNRSVQ